MVKMSICKVATFVCLAVIPSIVPAAAEEFTNAIYAYLQECVNAEIPNGCIVVGIVDEHGSKVVSCGTLDNSTDQEANGDTVFGLHSMTGTFTSMLLQDMVERGEMGWGDPVAKYLPKSVSVPTCHGKEITLGHLATESSGLPDFRDKFVPKRADNPYADFTVEKLYAFVSGCELTNDPGTQHFHGGVDRGLLGQAMALKAGTNYESLLVDRICRPLKMDSTRLTLTPELKARVATRHNQLGYALPTLGCGALQPLNGLFSTASDLLKFLRALDQPPTNLGPLMERSRGCFFYASLGGETVYTAGGFFGCRALAGFDKARRRGLVILSTSADLMRNFGDVLLQSEWQADRRPAKTNVSAAILDACVGQYRPTQEPSGHIMGIWRKGDRLFAESIGSGSSPDEVLLLPPITAELLPQSETRFFERLTGRPVVFSRNTRGQVSGLTINCQGKLFSFPKMSDRPPQAPEPVKPRVAIKLDPKFLDAIVGHYEFAPKAPFPTGGKVTIWREGAQLSCQVWGENAIRGAFDIYPESETNFFIKLNGAQLVFIKTDKGQVTTIIHRSSRPGVADSEGKKLKD
jgi:D-alanyl-D-alanine-carboxypeptidase/D-alanyl-D-alanine-endopeptidase